MSCSLAWVLQVRVLRQQVLIGQIYDCQAWEQIADDLKALSISDDTRAAFEELITVFPAAVRVHFLRLQSHHMPFALLLRVCLACALHASLLNSTCITQELCEPCPVTCCQTPCHAHSALCTCNNSIAPFASWTHPRAGFCVGKIHRVGAGGRWQHRCSKGALWAVLALLPRGGPSHTVLAVCVGHASQHGQRHV